MRVLLLLAAAAASAAAAAAAASAAAAGLEHIHLAWVEGGTGASAMRVQWFSAGPQARAGGAVQFGYSASQLSQTVAAAAPATYNAAVGWHYAAELRGLKAGSRVYYRVGWKDSSNGGNNANANANASSWSAVDWFATRPADDAAAPLSLVVYGDMGVAGSEHVVRRVNALLRGDDADGRPAPAGVLHAGDIGYAGDYPPAQFEGVWARMMAQLQPAMRRAPYMVAPGNNDRGCKCDDPAYNYTHHFANYKRIFSIMPNTSASSPMWFSFDIGPVHVVSFSTETGFKEAPWGDTDGDLLAWMEKDLAEANLPQNRAKRPWVIVLAHRPILSSIIIYNDYFNPIGFPKTLQETFSPMFEKHNVDVFFNGHVHGYERSWPTPWSAPEQKSYDKPKSTVHLMVGSAGDTEGFDPKIAYSQIFPRFTAYRYISTAWFETKDYDHAGYGVARFANATTMEWDFYNAETNQRVDTITLTKDRS